MSFASFRGGLLGTDSPLPSEPPRLKGRFDGEHILVPLLTPAVPAITDQIKVATTLTRVTDASLSVISPLSAPEQTPEELHDEVVDSDDEALLEWAVNHASKSAAQVDSGFLYTRDVIKGVLRTVRTNDVDTLVLPSETHGGRLRKGITERIAAHAECDVVVVNGKAGYDKVASMLLPIAGGRHSGLAADLAQCIAADCDAWIDILHVIKEGASDRKRKTAEKLVEDVYHRIACPETTTTWVLEAADVAQAIVDQSRYYGLTVMGAPTKGRLRQFIHGSTNRSVRANAGSVVLSARNNTHLALDHE